MRSLGAALKRLLGEPAALGVDTDAPGAIAIHRKIIDKKPLLRAVYRRWYRELLPAYEQTRELTGPVVEIGCGAGFLDQLIPGLIKTDVVPNPYAQRVVDAMSLDFPDESVRALFLVGVLHHIPEPERFLREAQRCLQPGGRLVMVEPADSMLTRLLCRILPHYEHFDATVREWKNVPSSGRMSDANMALPWVIFIRDRHDFDARFPSLEVVHIRRHTFLGYYLSGGMSLRSAPAFLGPAIDAVERLARPAMRRLGSEMTIDIRKRQSSRSGTAR